MKKRKGNAQIDSLSYDDQGAQRVSEQINDSYNSGVIEQADNEKPPLNQKNTK